MVSRVRAKLIKIFLQSPKEMYYVRELTRSTKEEINAVRRELAHMSERGMVKSEPRGNRLYYQFRETYPFYPELIAIVAKTGTLGKEIVNNKSQLGFIKYAFLSSKFIRGEKREAGDVDLVIVGKVIMPQIAQIVKEYEQENQTEVNYSCMTEEEFSYRLSRKDPFITNLLVQPRVMLFGDEMAMVKLEK